MIIMLLGALAVDDHDGLAQPRRTIANFFIPYYRAHLKGSIGSRHGPSRPILRDGSREWHDGKITRTQEAVWTDMPGNIALQQQVNVG